MKNLKKFIIIIICLIIIIVAALFFIIIKGNSKKTKYDNVAVATEDFDKLKTGIQMSDYMLIKNCVNQYLEALNTKNSSTITRTDSGYTYKYDEQKIKTIIYSILDQSFIKENGITQENILQKINTMEKTKLFIPLEIKTIEKEKTNKTNNTNNIKSFKVKGITYETLDNKNATINYYIVNICSINTTFSIKPINADRYNKEIDTVEEIEIIEKKGYNRYTAPETGWQDVTGEYFNNCKKLMLLFPEYIYNKMPEEYRQKRFENIEGLKSYINKNKQRIMELNYTKYKVSKKDDYTEYLAQDQYGNTYVFQEKDVNNYKILLDAYTIPINLFIEKYNQGDEQVRVGMNIENIMTAINNKDFKYIFNHLNETFRNNNVKSVDNLQKYIEKRLFDSNEVKEYTKFNQEGNGVYSFEIIVKSMEDEEKTKNMTIIMKLKELTDFEMSFSIE